jgi:DNA-binding Lrp family transcriptional regulator
VREGRRTNSDGTEFEQRLTIPEAAEALGISPEAVRTRIARGQLEKIKYEGRVHVLLERDITGSNQDEPSTNTDQTELLEELRDRLHYVERQLEAEREVNRENRRLLLAALERIPPALEAPTQEPAEGPAPASEEPGGGTDRPSEDRPSERRSWWRRWFGG